MQQSMEYIVARIIDLLVGNRCEIISWCLVRRTSSCVTSCAACLWAFMLRMLSLDIESERQNRGMSAADAGSSEIILLINAAPPLSLHVA
jgi:hypothetical protein